MTAIQELGYFPIQHENHPRASNSDRRNTFLENFRLRIEAQNDQIASVLSLTHNEPDDMGRTRVQQEEDRLNRINREDWERTKSPMAVGEDVLIPVGTPVGLGSDWDSYITEEPLHGTLINVFGGYGGDSYLGRSTQVLERLFKVVVVPEEQEFTEPITLLVPNDLLIQIPQA